MEDENQLERELERQLEKELDELPAQDSNSDDDDDVDGVEGDETYEEYDLIVIPGQPKPEQLPDSSSDDDAEKEQEKKEKKELEKNEKREQQRDAMLQSMRQAPGAAGGGGGNGDDLTTIEIMSSDTDDDDSQSNKARAPAPTGRGLTSSSDDDDDDDDDEVGVIPDSDSEDEEDNKGNIDSSSEDTDDSEDFGGSTDHLERAYADIMERPHKQYSHLVQLSELAFKLNDLSKIEFAVQSLQKLGTVPAHIWLKYLKGLRVVTQTPEECKDFVDKCATALGYHYNIHLSEYIVDYLSSLEGKLENHVMWAKLLADYDVERPDYANRLRPLMATLTDENESSAFQELLRKHCITWQCTPEQREIIKPLVDDFKRHLEEMKMQHNDWDWAKMHKSHVEEVLSLALDEDLKNVIIRFIFERCVAKFPTVDTLWLDYMQFIQGPSGDDDGGDVDDEDEQHAEAAAKRASRLGKGYLCSTVLDLAKRGVRCRPSVRLNHKLLVLMERADYDQPAVDEEISKILERLVPDMNMTVELRLDYLAYRVRNTNASDAEQAESLRAAFYRIWEELSSLYGDKADTRYEVLQLWAQVEYTHLANPVNGANIWRQIMGYEGSSERGLLWLSYAQMESEYNAGQGTRDVLREALSQPFLEDGLMVQELYRRYERCYGTYETIAACQAVELPRHYVTRYLPPPRLHRTQQAQRQNPQQQQHLNREQRRRQAHEVRGGGGADRKPYPALKIILAPPRPPIEAKTLEVRESPQTLKYSPHLETNKVFVKNLHPACTKEELQELFKPHGHIKDVRVIHKQKQMKGIAYVEFEKPEEAQKAVDACNGHELHGLAIFVAISNPPPKAGKSGDGPNAKVAPKRRVLTSLIPTTVVRQEAAVAKKRRLEVQQMEQEGGEPPSSSSNANGKAGGGGEAAEETAPKSNDDFRKLFIKDK